jgi:SET domain-containing protein
MFTPLPPSLELRESQIHGLGLFAREFVPNETVLGISHVAHDLFPDGWIRTPLGGFYNHSETPNCKLLDQTLDGGFITGIKILQTIIDIEAGDELTCFYTIWTFPLPI